MAISGYVMAYSAKMKGGSMQRSFASSVLLRFHRLMTPYIVWAFLVLPWAFKSWNAHTDYVSLFSVFFITNNGWWFLPCLFLLSVFYYVYMRIRAHWAGALLWRDLLVIAGVGVLVAGLYAGTHVDFLRSVISYLVPFFVGVLMVQYPTLNTIVCRSPKVYALAVVVLCLCYGGYAAYLEESIGKAMRLVCGLASLPIFFGCVARAAWPDCVARVLSYVGKRTLIIYILHNCFFPHLLVADWNSSFCLQLLFGLLFGGLSMIPCLVVSYFIEQSKWLRIALLS